MAAEETSNIRHEYIAGHVYAMAGPSFKHDRLSRMLNSILERGLRGTSCSSITSDFRIRIEAADSDLYSDGAIYCGPPSFENEKELTLLNAKVIFEVLSPTTEKFDKGGKFLIYKQIPTLTDYLLVSQERVIVDHYRRKPDGWLLNTYLSREDSVTFPEIPLTIQLSELYQDIDVPSGIAIIKD